MTVQKVNKGISGALQYHNDFLVPALAVAVAIDGTFPQKILNEVRNALTHLSRAEVLKKEKDFPKALLEIKSAERHLMRTTLDCLKISIIAYAAKTEIAMKALLEDIELPEKTHSRSNELREKRHQLTILEGQEPTDDAVQQYGALTEEFAEFYHSLDDDFNGDTAEQRRASRIAKQEAAIEAVRAEKDNEIRNAKKFGWKTTAVGLAGGLIISWAANHLPILTKQDTANVEASATLQTTPEAEPSEVTKEAE